MANVVEMSLIDESKVMSSITSSDKKVEFVPLPFEMKLNGSVKDKENAETILSSKRNQLETSLASYGFVFDNAATESVATAQFSLQNPVNMMSAYYENVNVSFANNSGYSNAIFLPYLSYGGGLDNNQLNYIPIAFPNYEEVGGDAPEFIDISEMPMELRNDDSLKDKNSNASKSVGAVDDEKISSDDDIIFVGSYVRNGNDLCTSNKENEDKPDTTKKGDNNRKPRKKVNVIAERKNPKRTTRSCRASESLALKQIPQKVFNAKVKSNCQQCQQTKISRPTNKNSDSKEDGENISQKQQEKKPANKTVKKYKPKKPYSRRKNWCNARTKAKTSGTLLTRVKLVELLVEASETCVNFADNIKTFHQTEENIGDDVKEENLKIASDVMTNSKILEEFFKKFA